MTSNKTLPEIKRILKAEKPHLARDYGVTELGVFGSYVHGTEDSDSDLDVLIDLERPPRITLLGLVELQNHLSSVLDMDVDVAVKSNLRKRIGKRILDEVVLGMTNEFLDYVEDMLDAIDKAGLLVRDVTYDQFADDFRINFAVVRALEIIGEAATRLPQQLRDEYPAIPWRNMIGMRNRIIHGYDMGVFKTS